MFKCTCPITKGAEVVLSLCWTCRGVKALNKMKSISCEDLGGVRGGRGREGSGRTAKTEINLSKRFHWHLELYADLDFVLRWEVGN